jgi:hypothetical protein
MQNAKISLALSLAAVAFSAASFFDYTGYATPVAATSEQVAALVPMEPDTFSGETQATYLQLEASRFFAKKLREEAETRKALNLPMERDAVFDEYLYRSNPKVAAQDAEWIEQAQVDAFLSDNPTAISSCAAAVMLENGIGTDEEVGRLHSYLDIEAHTMYAKRRASIASKLKKDFYAMVKDITQGRDNSQGKHYLDGFKCELASFKSQALTWKP